MKKSAKFRALVALAAPLFVLSSLVIGSFGSFGKAFAGPLGQIQVGFVTNLQGFPANIQNVFLNVQQVRVNPKIIKGGPPPEANPKWVAIPVPTGTGVGLAGQPGDLQIDALAGQTSLQLFNTANVRLEKYQAVEVILDTTNPGYVVPVCSSVTGASLEGCIPYGLTLQSPGSQISFLTPVTVSKTVVTALPIQINITATQFPSKPGGGYVAAVSISSASTTFEATVTGSVGKTVGSGRIAKKVRRLQVFAELADTNTIVSQANVVNGKYLLTLPAPPAGTDQGLSYDLYVSGGGASYEATRLTGSNALFSGTTTTVDFPNVTGNHKLGNISGLISDLCTGLPIIGAVENLLVPPDSNSSADCATTPSDCVVVASATTDDLGDYPLPGTVREPAPFNNVPIDASTPLTMDVTMPGYNTLTDPSVVSTVRSKTGDAGTCSVGVSGTCSYDLPTSYISGIVNLEATPAPSTWVTFQVFAEASGTNQLVSALTSPVIIRNGNQSGAFTLNVPAVQAGAPDTTLPGPANLDLFAEAIDLYAGGSDPYPGHTVLTASAIAAPTTFCQTITPAIFSQSMECVGHGSITGALDNPDINTYVEVSKNNVQLMSAAPVNLLVPIPGASPSATIGNGYSFCIPPDSYQLTRYESVPGETPYSTPSPVATQSITVMAPVPTSSPSPCPSTCEDAVAGCPSACGNTVAPAF